MLVSIQAGNSDNKLTQQQWARFVATLNKAVADHEQARHFFGGSITWAEWQNVCWVFEVELYEDLDYLRKQLTAIRKTFDQDSVCLLVGSAEFI